MSKYILGIDPGLKGVMSLLSLDGLTLDWLHIPSKVEVEGTSRRIIDAKKMYAMLDDYEFFDCYIEQQAYKNPKLIANYGICLAVLQMLEIPYMALAPAQWMGSLKKKAGLKDIKNKDKAFTLYAFKELYPNIELPMLGSLPDDNVADASLLAQLCYLNLQKELD